MRSITSRWTGHAARTGFSLLAALLLAGSLSACSDGGSSMDEAVEEMQDEAEDAKEEIEDEMDDMS